MHSENFSVPITIVPFRNGNLEKNGNGKFYEETYKIEGFLMGSKSWRLQSCVALTINFFSFNFQRFFQLFPSNVSDIPEKTVQAKWCLRKVIINELSSHKRNKCKIELKYKPEHRVCDEVAYLTASETDVTNIPTAEEQNKNVVYQSVLQKGLIITNDLFFQQMEEQTIGTDVEVIRHNQLQPLDWKPALDEVAKSMEDGFMEQSTKKPRVVSNPKKQPRIKRAITIRLPAELLQLHSEHFSVPLTVAPLRNDNSEKDGIGKFSDETYQIEGFF